MKTKQFLSATLCAFLAFASCSKEEGAAPVPGPDAPKSVTIQLGNALTRSSEPSWDAAKDKAVLGSAYILLAKADGEIVKDGILDANGQNNPASFYVTEVGDLANGITFHLIPSEVTQIAVVGNVDRSTAEKWNNLSEVANYTRTLQQELEAWNSQTDEKQVTLYGVCDEFEPYTPADAAGQKHANYWKATVEMIPMLSRIEIVSIECTDFGTEYTKFDINQFAIANFNQSANFTGKKAAAGDKNPAVAGSDVLPKVADIDMSAYLGAPASDDKKPSYSFDAITSPIPLTVATRKHTFPATGIYAYNVFPGTNPQVIVGMKDQNGTPLFIRSDLFSNTATPNILEPGKIYRVTCEFPHDAVNHYDNQCVMVVASVKDWDVEPITLTFQ